MAQKAKKNPNSLRELLTDVRKASGLDQKSFAAVLSRHGRGYGKRELTVRTLGKIERDEEYIKYLHIEKYAEYLGIPSGLLLLASRMRANARSGNKLESNRELTARLTEILSTINEGSSLAVEEISKWKRSFEQQQLSLPLPARS